MFTRATTYTYGQNSSNIANLLPSKIILLKNPLAPCTYDELDLRQIVNNWLYFGTCRPEASLNSLSHEYKLNLITGQLVDLTPNGLTGHVAFQSQFDGRYIYSVGQQNVDPIALESSLLVIDTQTDTVTPVNLSGTVDADELTACLLDGAYLYAVETNGIWKIPVATYNNTATWSKTVDWSASPKNVSDAMLVKINNTYYLYHYYELYQSSDLITWTASTLFNGIANFNSPLQIRVDNNILYMIGTLSNYNYVFSSCYWSSGNPVISSTDTGINTNTFGYLAKIHAINGRVLLSSDLGTWQVAGNHYIWSMDNPADPALIYNNKNGFCQRQFVTDNHKIYFASAYPGFITAYQLPASFTS